MAGGGEEKDCLRSCVCVVGGLEGGRVAIGSGEDVVSWPSLVGLFPVMVGIGWETGIR